MAGTKRDFALIKHGHSLDDLDDVDLAGVVDNSLIQYDAVSGDWQDVTLANLNGQLDHGLLLGNADDDHTQYHTDARALTWLGTRSTSDLPEGTRLYFTDERAQDAVGTILTDSTSIDFTYNDGSNTITASTINANPSGLIGMSAVNGTAATPLRSDGRHAIDPSIAPSWTGIHSFQAVGNGAGNASLELRSTRPQLNWYDTDGGSGAKAGGFDFTGGTVTAFFDDDTFTGRSTWLIASRSAATLTTLTLTASTSLILNTGKFRLPGDNQELQLGASDDLRLYHDGTNSLIRNDTGSLRLQGGTNVGLAIASTGALSSAQTASWTNVHTWNGNGLAGGNSASVDVYRDDDTGQANIVATTYGTVSGGTFHANYARGTLASPSKVLAGDVTGGIGSRYYTGAAFHSSSPTSIHWQATEDADLGNGSWLRLLTTPKGSTTRQERGGVTDNGTIWSHDTATYNAKSSVQTLPQADARFVASGTSGVSTGATFVAVGYGGITPGFRGMSSGSGGTAAAPNATVASEALVFMSGHGHDGTDFVAGSKSLIISRASQNWTTTANGCYINFETTPNGSATRVARARITEDGGWAIADGITAPATLAGFGVIYIDTADGDLKIKFGDGTVKTIVTD